MENNPSLEPEPEQTSPIPETINHEEMLDFYDALQFILEGHKITKMEWGNPATVGFMHDEKLSITINGMTHDWILSHADLIGNDYQVID